MPKKKDIFVFTLKFVFSASVLAFILISQTSLRDIFTTLKEADHLLLGISFSLHALGLVISAIRWQILIKAQDDWVPIGFLAKSYLVGSFFNLFLPTRIGGDVVRIWDGSRYSKSLIKSSAIVLVERLSGVIVLFLFAFCVSLIRLDMAQQFPVIWVSLILGFFGLSLLVLFLTPVAGIILGILPEKSPLIATQQKILRFRETILFYRKRKGALGKAFFWATLLQINVIFHYYLIGQALHLEIALMDYFIFIPIVHLILLIPITINGLGLREGAYLEIFRYYGISSAAAISFSWIDLAFMLIVGIVGGIIYIFRK
ncbi:MAG: flippase-like domain-containing protein [Candidatus Aminicenantes bacterium]|nr:flippase-like domain-containing protein [Candidatus Aminicenantes bacterium]